MSYARFGPNSDVYVFWDVGGFYQCCGCVLSDEWDFPDVEAILAHLAVHVDAGHVVPDYCLAELRAESASKGDTDV